MTRLWLQILLACFVAGPTNAFADIGDTVDFTLPKLGGGEVSSKDYRGQWLVVNYWATWCAPCRKEIPELSELHQERQDISVLGFAYEDIDDSALQEFLAEFEVAYPSVRVDVYDPPAVFGTPKALPTTHLLDPQSQVIKTFIGPITRADIEHFIDGYPAESESSEW